MSLYHKTDSLPRRFRLILASFLQRPGLAFVDVVSEQSINRRREQRRKDVRPVAEFPDLASFVDAVENVKE